METSISTFGFVIENNSSYQARKEVYEGKEYMVVPVVMMVEGVHEGSRGAVFHAANELGKVPDSYNGIPITIQHPQDDNGNFISANSPGVLDTMQVGKVFNTRFENNKLRGEAWLDIQRMAAISPLALAYINEQHPLEVSIGVFTDEDEVEGEWNGEQYEAIAYNHRPDHLALLPGGVGACSWQDGCGIRVNEKKGGNNVSEIKDKKKFPELFDSLKKLNSEGLAVHKINCLADAGYKQLVDNARRKLDLMDDDMKMHFLEEMFADYIVYEVRRGNGDVELYRRDYSAGQDGVIEFTSDPQRVQRKVEYAVQEFVRTKFNNNKKANTMEVKTHECADCEKLVKSLIANKKTRFAEEDREWLTALSEDQLNKLVPEEEKEPEKKTEVKKEEPVVNKEKLVEALSEEDKAALAYGRKQMDTRRKELVTNIQANAKDVWEDKELNGMDLETLEKISDSVKPVTDYSGLGGSITDNSEAEEPLYPAGVEVEVKK